MNAARGFSLLETLVAAALFAAVAALAWGGLDVITRARQTLAAEDAHWLALARQVGRFEQDLRQALPRPVATGDGEAPALDGRPESAGVTVWLPGARATVERVRWRCDEGQLRRQRWETVDRLPQTPSILPRGLDHDGCEMHYYDDRGQRSTGWPPPGASAARLPRAVELTLRIPGRGEYRRLVELPDASGPVPP